MFQFLVGWHKIDMLYGETDRETETEGKREREQKVQMGSTISITVQHK